MQDSCQLDRVAGRHDEDALADPHHAGTVNETSLVVWSSIPAFRDSSPAEHDLADPCGDAPSGTGDVV
jgi:hypothetical protein